MLAATGSQLKAFRNRRRMREMLERLRTDGFVRNFEIELRTKQGRFIPHLFSATVVNVAGEPCVIAIVHDISTLKQTERELIAAREALSAQVRELAASESKFRRVFETTTDSVAITDVATWHLVDVNAEFLHTTGFTREQVVGRTTRELGMWVSHRRLKEVTELVTTEGVVRNIDAEFRHQSGAIVTLLFSAVMVEIEGRPCVVSIARDISALKQTERELIAAREALSAQVKELSETQDRLRAEIAQRELAQRRVQGSEQTLRRIFETSLDAIAVSRWPDLTFVDINERHNQVFGISRERALAAPPHSFRLWARPDQFRQYRREMAAHGFVQNMEVEFVMRDGSVSPFLCSSALVELNGEQCAVSTMRDISRLKQTERELIAARESALAASEAKSHFLSVMSHEIRTPMNAILGMADLLWETSLNAEQRRYLDTMRNNGASLLNLVNGILDLSKVESGRLSLERVDFDLVELAEGVMETLGVRAHEKGLELALRIPSTFPTALTGDPLRLRQILINLLGNAIKFTEHGEVTLTIDAVDSAQAGEALARKPGPKTPPLPPTPARQPDGNCCASWSATPASVSPPIGCRRSSRTSPRPIRLSAADMAAVALDWRSSSAWSN